MNLNFLTKTSLTAIAIIIATLTTLSPRPAQARIIVNTGEELFEVGNFPETMVQTYPRLKDYKVAYLCQRFGIFWANIWTWDCQLMAGSISNKSVVELPPQYITALQKDYPFSQAERNYWNKYGFLTMVVTFSVLLLLVGLTKKPVDSTATAATQSENQTPE